MQTSLSPQSHLTQAKMVYCKPTYAGYPIGRGVNPLSGTLLANSKDYELSQYKLMISSLEKELKEPNSFPHHLIEIKTIILEDCRVLLAEYRQSKAAAKQAAKATKVRKQTAKTSKIRKQKGKKVLET